MSGRKPPPGQHARPQGAPHLTSRRLASDLSPQRFQGPGRRGRVGASGSEWGRVGTPPRDTDATVRRSPEQTRGQNPTSEGALPPREGGPTFSGSSKPQKRETENQGIIPTARRGPDSNASEKGRPGPQEGVPLPGGPSDPEGEPDFWRPRPGAGRGGCGSRGAPGPRARTHPAPGRRRRPRPPGSGPSACSSDRKSVV